MRFAFQTVDESQVPQGMLAVHYRAKKFSSQRLQFGVGAMFERDVTDVIANIKVGVVFPCRQTNIQRRWHHPLEITGKQRQFRFDELGESFERDLALQDADAGHVERHTLALQVQEHCVTPGKAVILLMVLHNSSPIRSR